VFEVAPGMVVFSSLNRLRKDPFERLLGKPEEFVPPGQKSRCKLLIQKRVLSMFEQPGIVPAFKSIACYPFKVLNITPMA